MPLTSLRHIGGALSIGDVAPSEGNTLLVSVSGFATLETIGGDLAVGSNPLLESLPDFTSLRSIGGQLIIGDFDTGNPSLTSLPAFPALRHIGRDIAGNLNPITIAYNDMLSMCCGIFPFVQATLPDGYTLGGIGRIRDTDIGENPVGCASVGEIRASTSCFRAHEVSVSPTTPNVEVGVDNGTTIDIHLPPSGGSAALTIDVGGGATGFTATEASDTENFVSTVTPSGSDNGTLTITYSAHRSTSSRTATITLSTTGLGTPITRTLSLTQAPSTIVGNVQLDSVEAITYAIRSATRIEGHLTIGDGEAGADIMSTHLAGFAVDTITEHLVISGTKLTTLDAFSSLRHIGGALSIGDVAPNAGNTLLVSVSGFATLETIGGDLAVGSNPLLESLPDFTSLRSIGGHLSIGELDFDNPSLTSLPAFPALRHIGRELGGHLKPIIIKDNDMLSMCCGVFPFVQEMLPDGYTLGGDGGLQIAGNTTGCTSVAQIRASSCVRAHEVSVSTTETNIEVGADDGTTIDIHLPPSGGSAALTIDVGGGATGFTATEASDDANFVTISTSASAITINYSANTGTSSRMATITLSTTPSSGSITRTLSLTQVSSTFVGDVRLDSMEAITYAIRSATRIEGDLVIGDGDRGEDIENAHLAGFAVETIAGNLTIQSTKLTTLDAFSSLRIVEGDLQIGIFSLGNAMLGSVSGFDVLDSIRGQLYIEDNALLTTITAFAELDSIGNQLYVASNGALTSLPSFPMLRSIGASVSSGTSPIIITNNAALSVCCGVFAFVQGSLPDGYTLGGNRMVTVSSNTTGCDDLAELRASTSCVLTHTVTISTTTAGVTVNALKGTTIPISLPADGTTAALTIDLGGDATGWTATEASDTENFVSAVTGIGADEGMLTINYSANAGTSSRTATITLRTTPSSGSITRTLELTQAASTPIAPPTVSVATVPSELTNLTAEGGTVMVDVTIGGSATGFTVTEADAADFLSAEPTSRTGDGSFTITYATNEATSSRSGTVTISTTGEGTAADTTITLTQTAFHTVMVSTTTADVDVGAESGGTISVSLPADGTSAELTIEVGNGATGFTAEEASDDDNFVTISTSASAITINYSANTAMTNRTATITLRTKGAGTIITRTLSLTQRSTAPPTIAVATNPSELTNLTAEGGTVMVSVTLGGSAARWTVTETDAADFLSAEPSSGVGNSSFTITYAANEEPSSRSGIVTISTTGSDTPADTMITLTQAAPPHTVTITSSTDGVSIGEEQRDTISINLHPAGTEAVLTIDVGLGATSWTAEEADDPENFVNNVTASGSDLGSLTIRYTENEGIPPRVATITLRTEGPGTPTTKTLSLRQRSNAPSTISVTTDPSELTDLAADGGTAMVNVTIGGSATGWEAIETDRLDFLSLEPSSGMGNGSFTITYAANQGIISRTGIVTISATGGTGTPATEELRLTQATGVEAPTHTISVSTTTTGVSVTPGMAAGTERDTTINIGLPTSGTEAVFMIGIGEGATGWTATKESDPGNFVSSVTSSGSNGTGLTITYTENTTTSSRRATITLRTTGAVGPSITATLSLTQAAASVVTFGLPRGEGEVVLYPNPVSERLHLRGLQNKADVRISTLGGAIVRRSTVSSANSFIDIRGLAEGTTYVVVIEASGGSLSRHLVIIR